MSTPLPQTWTRNDYTVTTDKSWLDIDIIHGFLSASYWSPGIPRKVVERGIRHSECFGIYHHRSQVGFARVITDYTSFAYLADVFVLEAHRDKGLSKWLMECILSHPQLQGLRRWMLATRDAQGLYAKYGFTPLHEPGRFMQRWNPYVYQSQQQQP